MVGATFLAAGGVSDGVAPALAQEVDAQPVAVRHHLVGRHDCLMCHRVGAIEVVPDVPATHADRPSDTCLWCHDGASRMQTARPGPIPHEIERRVECLLCHTAGRIAAVPDMPDDHEGRTDERCTLCHQPEPSRRR